MFADMGPVQMSTLIKRTCTYHQYRGQLKQWCHGQEELRANEHARELLQTEMMAEQRRAQEAVVRLQELQVRLKLLHSC